jgi:FMN phosphatase YigB (HAD superfamily)
MSVVAIIPQPIRPVVIFDIDGTLADNHERQKFLMENPPDWKNYNYNIPYDNPRWEIVKKLCNWSHYADIALFTARGEEHRNDTERWLKDHDILYQWLVMRPIGNYGEDAILKKEMFEKFLMKERVILIYDDRPKVIRMWRSMGLDVIDVGSGIEF